jgi:16S rRNA (guanine966-N2)-methyltransferase
MRITGGQHRSRLLCAPRGDTTRPTSDRVREALFAILGSTSSLAGARVLDLYAGTGALAFEALSRGATAATLVEPERSAVRAIMANAKALGVEAKIRVISSTLERAAATVRAAGTFDLVFADPPYASITNGGAQRALGELLCIPESLLAKGAQVVLEHGKGDLPPPLPGLKCHATRRYGDTCLSFYELGPPGAEAHEGGGDGETRQR